MMKHRFSRLIVFTVLLAALAGALPLKEVSASSASVVLGTYTPPPIVFEETGSYVKLNNSAFVVEFYKDSAGYNKIYNASGDVVVYDERHYLEYWKDPSWKVRGIPYDLTWIKVSDYHYNVTRHYTDYLGTDWNVTFVVKSWEPIKSAVSVDSGQTDTYRISWALSGVVYTDAVNESNAVQFGGGRLAFRWDDVFESFGNITTASVESHAQGRKLTVNFDVGEIAVGTSLVLDPAVDGSTTGSATGDSYQRRIVYDGTYWWLFYHNGTGWKYKYSSDLSTISGGATVEDVGTGGRAGGISVTFDGSTGIQTFYGYGTYILRQRGGTISGTTISWGDPTTILTDSSYYTGQGSVYNPTDGKSWVAIHKYTSTDVYRWRYTTWWQGDVIDTAEAISTTTGGIAMVTTTTGIFNVLKDSGNNLRYSTDSNDFAAIGQTSAAGYGAFSVVSEGDVVHLAYLDASNNLEYIRWNGTAWGDVETIMASASNAFCFPVVSLDDVNGALYVFWGDDTTDDIYYRKRDSTGASGTWDSSSTTLVDETALVGGDTYGNGRITAPLYFNNSQIPVMYTTGTASPYTVKVVSLAASTNSDPTITSASSPDLKDTDNMYGMDGYYSFQVVVNDADGATDIDKVYLQAKSGETVRWEVRATSLTGTPSWAIQTGDTIIDITTSSWSEDGNVGTATFEVRAEFDHPGYADLELAVYVEDSAAASAGWTDMQTDYFDIINRVVVENFAASDTRHNVGGTVTFSGNIYYATTVSGNTASSYYPANALFTGIDIHDASHANKANDLTILNGAFTSSAVTLSSSVTSTNYHVYINLAGDGTDGDAPDGDTVAVVSDRIEIVSVAFDDSRINVGGSAEVRYVLRYDYDDVQFDSGKGSITGFTWDGVNSWWDKAITGSASVISTNWDESDLAITDSTYGLTAIEDDAGTNIITDRVEVYYEELDDSRVNININIEYRVKARLDYDDHELGTGDSVTANSGAMAWDSGNGWFDDQRTTGSVGDYVFSVSSASEATHGITSLWDNAPSRTGIWDRIEIVSVAFDDSRVNIGANAEVRFTLRYDYDDVAFTDAKGSITGYTFDTPNGWWEKTVAAPGSPGSDLYDENDFAVTDSTYGLTAEEDDAGASLIGDRINFKTTTLETTDAHINSDATGEWYAELLYEYDSAEVTDGTVTLNTGSMSWDSGGDHRWEHTNAPAAVADVARNIASVSGNTHGITSLNSAITSDSETIEFDEVVFQTGTFSVTDGRINYNTNGEWYVKLMLDNNDEAISSGTITLNTGAMSYDGVDTRWEYTNSKGSVGTEARNVASVSGLTGGITKINAAVTGDSETVIFDRVHATATTASDNRDDINDNVNIDFTLKYDYDEAAVTDGTVTIEGFAAAHQGSGVWRITKTSAAVTTVTYNEFTSSGNAYGITLVDMDGQAGEEVIWDRIEIVSVAFSDSRINIGGGSEVRYVLRYDFDDVPFDSGKGSITGFTWDGVNSWWDKAITGSGSVATTNWDESDLAITDSTYGLTAVEDDAGANIITDRVEVYYEAVDDSLVLKDENIEYRVKARLDYDNHELGTGDSVTANSGAMAWDAVNSWFDDQRTQATVGSYLFDVTAASEATHGITALYEPQSSPTGYWKDTPGNDAADSDATYDVDIYGWVNVTVTDEDGVANLATVEVQVTTSGSEVFTLRWTQSSGVFSEQSDASGVCTLDVSGSTRVNVDADTDRIGFRFKVSAGAQMGAASVQATTIDDDSYSDQDTYSSEFSVNWYGEITIGDGSHSWSTLSPGDSQQTLDAPVDTDIDVTVSSNGAFDLQGKVNQAPTSGAYTIPLSNLLIHEDTVGSASALTTGYVDIGGLTGQSRGLSLAKSFKLWLTVPNPQQDGSYTYTLSVQITTP